MLKITIDYIVFSDKFKLIIYITGGMIMSKKIETLTGKPAHPWVGQYIADFKSGLLERREFLSAITALGVTAASALTLAGLPSKANAQTPKKGGVVRFSQTVQKIADPAYGEWSQHGNAFRPMLDGLILWNDDGTFQPWLAEKWEYSTDLKTFTLHLRKGVKWTNGDEFNASDITAIFDRWLNKLPKTSMQSKFDGMLEEYDTGKKDDKGNAIKAKKALPNCVKVVDSHTVQLIFTKPDISIPGGLSDYPSLITHRDFEKNGGNFWDKPIGTGAFEVAEYKVGERAVYNARKSGYWGKGPYIDQLVYVDLGEDAGKELAAFSAGQIDINYKTAPDQVSKLEAIKTIQKNEKATAGTLVMRFNQKTKPGDNKKLRQALNLSVDNQKVLEIAYAGKAAAAENHHVAPIHPEYAKLPAIKRDVAAAKKLLAEAGYPNGVELEMICIDAPKFESDMGLSIADQAKDAGIKINVKVLPGGAYWDKWDTWPLSITAWNGRPFGTQIYNLAYRSGAVWNEAGYSNPELDKLLDEADKTPDAKKRSVIMEKLEKIMQEDAVILQPFWQKNYNFQNTKLKNFKYHFANEFRFHEVWID